MSETAAPPLEAKSPFEMRVHLGDGVPEQTVREALASGDLGFLHSFTTGSTVDGPPAPDRDRQRQRERQPRLSRQPPGAQHLTSDRHGDQRCDEQRRDPQATDHVAKLGVASGVVVDVTTVGRGGGGRGGDVGAWHGAHGTLRGGEGLHVALVCTPRTGARRSRGRVRRGLLRCARLPGGDGSPAATPYGDTVPVVRPSERRRLRPNR